MRQEGASGIVSERSGRPSNNRAPVDLTKQALDIIRDLYADFGPSLACEKLQEVHGVELSKETIRKLMLEAGIWIPRRLRAPTIYQLEAAVIASAS